MDITLGPVALRYIQPQSRPTTSSTTKSSINGSSNRRQPTLPPSLPTHLPLYLVHGFRWPRKAVRIHVIMHNILDAAPDYTMSASSSTAFLTSLRTSHPQIMSKIPSLKMVEEYDPSDEGGEVQEYAWVADQIVRVNGDADVKRAKEQGLRGEAWDAMADLRDEVAKGEALGWWVILNGDPERGDKGAGAGGRGWWEWSD
ncbi:MAG: hypothetical protein OHK93_006833 [Ramalina farinacea]|uniref:Uncharacterized protein n=1 Tax=Ramalina farinacea TaxID=258253 RepID=A0AA43TTG8_9LECA|nr:hypothetical protein [Ramalina farinacea]